MMREIHAMGWFDWLCDGVAFLFLAVLITFGPDVHAFFIPAELVFVLVFSSRFIIKKSKLTIYTLWGLGLIALSFLSLFYATNRSMAFERALSVVQVIVFGNLFAPYMRESERNYRTFLVVLIGSVALLTLRIILSAPFADLLSTRLGPTVYINANTLGLSFAFAGIVSLYLAVVEKRFWYLALIPIFTLISLFSGSRKAIAVLAIGFMSIVFFSRKSREKAFLSLGVAAIAVVGLLVLSFIWDPLYAVIGSRIKTFMAFFVGGQTDGSTSIRFEMIMHGGDMFLQKPLFGWGLGAFTDVAGFGFYSHNNYIELLVSLGLVGFLWYYSLPVFILAKGIYLFFHNRMRKGSVLSLTIVLIFLVDDIGRVRLYSEFSHILYALAFVGVARLDASAGVDIFHLFAKAKEFLVAPRRFVMHVLKWRIARLIPDGLFLSCKYRMNFGRKLNLVQPRLYNEKIQWLKLHDHNPLYTTIADKSEVRKFITEKVGEKYLVPILGIYSDPKEIDISTLPDQFVLKPTHTSGDVLICLDKEQFDWNSAMVEMQHWMQRNYYWYDREWPYKGIVPKIICEPYLVDESGYELKDYKIFTFSGEPKFIQVDWGRYSHHMRNIYSLQWNYLNVQFHYPTDPDSVIPKPEKLDEMLAVSKILAKGFAYLRVDFYVLQDHLYIGELTLYHGSGFEPIIPQEIELEMGSWLQLPIDTPR